LTVKASLIFGKRFTIFKTVNRFPKLNTSFLHARLISDCQNLAIVDRWNPTGAEVQQRPDAGSQIPAKPTGYDRILPLIGPDPVKRSRQNPATGRCRIPATFVKF